MTLSPTGKGGNLSPLRSTQQRFSLFPWLRIAADQCRSPGPPRVLNRSGAASHGTRFQCRTLEDRSLEADAMPAINKIRHLPLFTRSLDAARRFHSSLGPSSCKTFIVVRCSLLPSIEDGVHSLVLQGMPFSSFFAVDD